MTDTILVLGKDGILGQALCAQLGPRAQGLSRTECDFMAVSFLDSIDQAFMKKPFAAIINAGAYTRVDDAENEDSGTLLRVNAVAPGELAHWCERHGIPLVHFSTDYVFDGHGSSPWKEDDTPAPLNAYGMSKLVGERAITATKSAHLIFRTSWVYADHGRNFFTTMRALMREKESLSVVDDQIGAPTFAGHLAAGAVAALEAAMGQAAFPSGIYHLCSGGETSWYGFAKAILARETEAVCREILPVAAKDYPGKTTRPQNSRLDCGKARLALHVAMPSWEDGLDACYGAASLR